ncbi:saccharopine dehydrogenase NADP-binding domain-containing protein [Zoogloea sp. LCSB751]|uniref:saccharopine dehydrogenase NADP-binding domain-containing protein n=1 Tax=Zoogloea sp. LCSB751 TaxID=1965277 RepID=UPI0009A4A139|nr:saccharopine dehydrogenase NADP-binding domain-containing protein [Zoogloea sp. LCSB751]
MRILLIGFGSVGQALLPLLRGYFGLSPASIEAIAADERGRQVADAFGIRLENRPLTPGNYRDLLHGRLRPGDVLINVAVDVSSLALIGWCREHGVLYLDTCVEPWAGGYAAADASTTNHALRNAALAMHAPGAPTAVIAHGANPGLVSHLAKEGLLALAAVRGIRVETRAAWAAMTCALGVRVVQIAERDTQRAGMMRPAGCFDNTWSVDGFLSEAWQCAELGWGSHEPCLPLDAHRLGADESGAIHLDAHGAEVRVKSWLPSCGEQEAWLITHHEALSLAGLLTLRDGAGSLVHRPTVYYAYRPCPAAVRSLEAWVAAGFPSPRHKQVLGDALLDGFDQLGVLFVFDGGAYWYGSTLTLHEARALAPHNTATSLPVVAGILGALDWMRAHPRAGVVEAEAMDHARVLAVARPYLGTVSGVLTDWQPGPAGELSFDNFRLSSAMRKRELEAV